MSRRGTLRRRARSARRGSALLGTMVVMLALLGILYAASTMSAVEVKQSQRATDALRAQYLAEGGVERGVLYLNQAIKNTSMHDPLGGLTNLFAVESELAPFVAEPVIEGARKAGAYSIRLTLVDHTATSVSIAIDSTGYVPDAPSALADPEAASWHAVRAVVQYRLAPSQVFDYGYFINNWGWFYGDTIYCNGNVRSNGQFDSAGYSPSIGGQPLYDAVSWDGTHATLSGYHDDNKDGLTDGGDGGVFAGWDIVGAQNVKGVGGKASNQHDFQDQVPMPNLSNLSEYEANAIQQNGSIKVGGTVLSDAVYGDEPGELQNLYLVGTPADPIVLDGPVVVRGNLVISGTVTGQGAIYSGGNVYVPNSIQYKNPPTSVRPGDNTQASDEQWLADNWGKDFLGLFSRESVVVGDFTDWVWQYYEAWWMGDSMNSSKEDAGADGIPNTRAGKDGKLGTADDDVLEGDGLFTTEHYTQADADLGLIPPGKSVGDAIPGTGEDIDGDGVYDAQAGLSDVLLATPLDGAHFGGNLPPGGIASYSSIASMYANNLDAVFYTNHSFCYTVLGGSTARINGALVSRNENIVYGTPSVEINYDARLLGGSSGWAARLLPSVVLPAEIVRWTQLDRDPNRYPVNP